jgi:hypothetical protein
MRRAAAICASFSAWSPCEKFSRRTSTPAPISSSMTAGSVEAGPRVATIFVRLNRLCMVTPLLR